MTEAPAAPKESAVPPQSMVPSGEITDNTTITPAEFPVTTIDGKTTPATSTSSNMSKDRSNSNRHRRVNSDGMGSYSYQQRMAQYPPAQIVYKNSGNGNKKDNNGQATPPLPSYSSTHSRERSWSGSAGGVPVPFPGMPPTGGYPMPPSYPGMPPPPPGQYSASPPPSSFDPTNMSGNLPPSMMGGPPMYGVASPPSPGHGGNRQHRRVHSYSGHVSSPSYGSMDGAAAAAFFSGVPLPPVPRTPRGGRVTGGKHSRSNSGDFSAVSEIRGLAGGGFRSERSPRRSPMMAPHSPMRLSPSHHARQLSGGGVVVDFMSAPIPPPLMMPSTGYVDVGAMNHHLQQSPRPPTVPNRGVYMGEETPSDLAASLRGTFRAATDRSDGGGEAVYLLNGDKGERKAKKHARKMHMRQKSAQLFMEDVKGAEQLPSCRDIFFLLFFVFHLLGIVWLGRSFGYESERLHDETMEDSDSSITVVYTNLIYIAGLSGIVGVVISGLTFLLMTMIAQKIVQVALGLAITFSFVWGTMGIGLSPRKIVPVTGIIALALIIAYAFIVWDRIPFAAANLSAGLKGIRSNPGAVLVAFLFQFLALGWSIYYTFVMFGVYDAIQLGDVGDDWEGMKYIIYTLLGISYFWTLNVFSNIVQATVAGVIGKWWYKPDGDIETNGADLKDAFFRSCFYSIGSICFGSLVVGPVRILRQLSAFFRPSEEVNSLLCLHECIHCIQTCLASCVDNLGDRFNSWSFTYIGLYGYGLVDAGLHATELFEKRGWTTIVSDDLVPNVLIMISLAIGGLTGMVAYLLEQLETLSLTSLGVPLMTSFAIGFLVGLVVSSVLFGIISSSVNASIVLFAASPVDFEENHPKLSEEMRNAWREVWPGCMDVIDMRFQVAGYLDPKLNGSMRLSERHPLLP